MAYAVSGALCWAVPVSRLHSHKVATADLPSMLKRYASGQAAKGRFLLGFPAYRAEPSFQIGKGVLVLVPVFGAAFACPVKGAGGVLPAKARSGTGPTRSRLRRAWGGPSLCREVPRSSRDKSSEGGTESLKGRSHLSLVSQGEPYLKHLVGLWPTLFCDRTAVARFQKKRLGCSSQTYPQVWVLNMC